MKPRTVALTPILQKLMPLCFVTGAAIELFMVKTGFCTCITLVEAECQCSVEEQERLKGGWCAADEIVTLKEAERRQQRDEERQEFLAARDQGL